jgi:ATP-dependent Lhr-like helicase
MAGRVAGRIDHMVLDRVSPLAAPLFLEAGRVPVKGAAEERLLAEEAARLMESSGLAQITPPPAQRPKWRVGW